MAGTKEDCFLYFKLTVLLISRLESIFRPWPMTPKEQQVRLNSFATCVFNHSPCLIVNTCVQLFSLFLKIISAQIPNPVSASQKFSCALFWYLLQCIQLVQYARELCYFLVPYTKTNLHC